MSIPAGAHRAERSQRLWRDARGPVDPRRSDDRHPDEPPAEPLYTPGDAFHAFEFFDGDLRHSETVAVTDGIRAHFLDACHIRGSATIRLQLDDGTKQQRMLFYGDLGNPGRPILRDPTPAPAADYVVTEATYGDRAHFSLPDSALAAEVMPSIRGCACACAPAGCVSTVSTGVGWRQRRLHSRCRKGRQ